MAKEIDLSGSFRFGIEFCTAVELIADGSVDVLALVTAATSARGRARRGAAGARPLAERQGRADGALIGNQFRRVRMMLQGWRWYGPNDPVSLDDIRQAGATDVVTALHQVPIGEAWTRAAVEERKNIIENSQPGRSPLTWSVVESIPVPDDVKRLGGKATRSIEAWIASLEAVAAAGIKIICYNFMPVVDWCRTDLEWELPNGARAMRFDQDRFAAFDLHILQRPEAPCRIFRGRAGARQSRSLTR